MRAAGSLFLLVAIAAIAALTPPARATVYRCTNNGKVTFSDTPCTPSASAGQPATPAAAMPSSNAVATPSQPSGASVYGTWTGQAQYQATGRGQSIEAAHAVVKLTLNVAADGKVNGESKDNGCRALGVASPQSPQTLKLDVSLTGCKYAGYNRRYTGTLGLPPGKDYVSVSLLAYDTRPGTTHIMYDIKATMRR